jgi:hypothetical protein
VLLLTLALVAMPLLKLEYRRRASRSHRPMAMELWMQEGSLIYIENVDDQGVHLLTLDTATKQLLKWTDSWSVWNARLRLRIVVFTGRSAALTLDAWDLMRT